MKFLDLFAGIGGFRLGMEAAGHECVGFCEIDKFARKSYKAIHGLTGENEYTEWEWHNVRSLSNKSLRKLQRRVGKIDVICGGFPCQSFSIAGKRRGFEETRGTLFFEIARVASILKPQYLFLENVKGLLNHAGGDTFETILRTLDELGYNCEWQLLNSKDFGVPQNRERVFIIGHLRESSGREVFPLGGENTGDIKCVVNGRETQGHSTYDVYGNVYDSERLAPTLTTNKGEGPKVAVKVKEATKKGYAVAEQGDSINLSVPNSKTRRGRVGKGIAQTLDTQCNQAVIVQKSRIKSKDNIYFLYKFRSYTMHQHISTTNVKKIRS